MSESWDVGDKLLVVQCSYISPLCCDVITTKDYKDVVHCSTLLSSLLVLGLKELFGLEWFSFCLDKRGWSRGHDSTTNP